MKIKAVQLVCANKNVCKNPRNELTSEPTPEGNDEILKTALDDGTRTHGIVIIFTNSS